MKINKSSWHYWLNNKMDMNIALQLKHGRTVSWCSYFWSTVGAVAKALWFAFIAALALLITGVFIFLVANMVTFLVTGVLGYPVAWVDYEMAMFCVIVSSILTVLVGIGITSDGHMQVVPEYLKPKDNPKAIKKEPSFFYTAYKSWKDKVCPLVELEK